MNNEIVAVSRSYYAGAIKNGIVLGSIKLRAALPGFASSIFPSHNAMEQYQLTLLDGSMKAVWEGCR
jgi:hypothetical protein